MQIISLVPYVRLRRIGCGRIGLPDAAEQSETNRENISEWAEPIVLDMDVDARVRLVLSVPK